MVMYFENRVEAGQMLAKKLQQYKAQDVTIIALSTGGVLVGEYLAKQLAGSLTLMLTRDIRVPGEPMAVGTINQSGDYTKNTSVSAIQLQEFEEEFHNHIEAEKLSKLYELNKTTGRHTLIDRHAFKNHTVILAADGLTSAAVVDAAYEFLKPIAIKRLVAAVPIATVSVVDRLHILTDEIHCLNVIEDNTFDVDHYYDDNNIPEEDTILEQIDHLARA